MKSAYERANFLAGAILTGRYLFILDGLEAVQYQDGEEYGLLQNPDLKDFLTYFASGEHESLCLITSRAPLIDLIDYITYVHRDVNRLKTQDGRDLLRYFLKDNGTDEQLDQVIERWDGHALTLSLIGAYVRRDYVDDLSRINVTSIDVNSLDDIQPPRTSGDFQYESYYERVSRVLRRYDEHLTRQEREFLKAFSAFRLPASQQAMEQILKADTTMVKRLSHYRILRHDSEEKGYTAHPLIRQYYLDQLKTNPEEAKAIHRSIKRYYLSSDLPLNQNPTLQDLTPFIEAVHHLCEAGDFQEARKILSELIDQNNNYVLTLQLGAYDTRLELLLEFFPEGNLSELPYGNQLDQYFILKETGFCLIALGRLEEAFSCCKLNIQVTKEIGDVNKLAHAYRDLVSLHMYLGELAQAAEIIKIVHTLNKDLTEPNQILNSLGLEGWIAHLRGELSAAKMTFQRLENLQLEFEPDKPYLYQSRGIFQADHLRRVDDLQKAKDIAGANLSISKDKHWPERESRCHRILGDIEVKLGNDEKARSHYDQALKLARNISHRPTLIEALRAQGVFLAHQGAIEEARNDLSEALSYAIKGGYRINEANIHIGLAWLLLKEAEQFPGKAKGKQSQARAEVEQSLHMSEDMGYYWGKVDAEEVLRTIGTNDDRDE